MPKTLLIYQSDYDFEPEFIVVEGDCSRFNNVFINSGEKEELENELLEFFYGKDGQEDRRNKGTKEFPLNQQPFTHVAVCGFIP